MMADASLSAATVFLELQEVFWVAVSDNSLNLLGLPIDDASKDKCQAGTCCHLFLKVSC